MSTHVTKNQIISLNPVTNSDSSFFKGFLHLSISLLFLAWLAGNLVVFDHLEHKSSDDTSYLVQKDKKSIKMLTNSELYGITPFEFEQEQQTLNEHQPEELTAVIEE